MAHYSTQFSVRRLWLIFTVGMLVMFGALLYFGGQIYQGWAPALLASASLETFPDRIARAHGAARDLFRRLEVSGRVKVRPAPEASNIFELELSPDLAAAALALSRGRFSSNPQARSSRQLR